MLFFNNQINAFKNTKLTKLAAGKNVSSENSLIDYNNPETFEIANRLRIQFEGIRREAETRAVKNAVKKEFGRDIPALESRVKDKLFTSSHNNPKTIGIV